MSNDSGFDTTSPRDITGPHETTTASGHETEASNDGGRSAGISAFDAYLSRSTKHSLGAFGKQAPIEVKDPWHRTYECPSPDEFTSRLVEQGIGEADAAKYSKALYDQLRARTETEGGGYQDILGLDLVLLMSMAEMDARGEAKIAPDLLVKHALVAFIPDDASATELWREYILAGYRATIPR